MNGLVRAFAPWAFVATALALGGCSESPQVGGKAVATASPGAATSKQAGNANAAAAAAASEATTFSYSPVGRRDPFRSYLTQVKERQEAQGQDHRHEDTENFDVSQYRLTGLITGTSRPKAMVDDPNGDAHVLHVGSRVGKNGGRVYSIGAQGVTVLEEYLDASGKAVSVPIQVRLPSDVYQDAATKE